MKPLLRLNNNLLDDLKEKYQLLVDLYLETKTLKAHGLLANINLFKAELLNSLRKIDIVEECPICMDTIEQKSILLYCQHSFCKECISSYCLLFTVVTS